MSDVDLGHIFSRVAAWNGRRYDREYNHELSIDLLSEELDEYFDAETAVDQLDALCDIIYVSMGILWKIDVPDETLMFNAVESHRQVAALLSTNTFEPIYFAGATLLRYGFDSEYPVALAAQTLITICMTQMSAMGLRNVESLLALLVVCDSNDSKSVKKTKSNAKANAGDKGTFFKAPEPRLQEILDAVDARYGN